MAKTPLRRASGPVHPELVRPNVSPYQAHCQRWLGCDGCALHRTRQNVCLARGKIPAEVLCIGEGPGVSEDVLGSPFVGPAGRLLDEIVRLAVPTGVRVAFTNLVACIPLKEGTTNQVEAPPDESVDACASRLQQFVWIADGCPDVGAEGTLKLIVCVGREPSRWLTPQYKHSVKFHRPIRRTEIVHPAYLLRQNDVQRMMGTQRNVVALKTVLRDALAGVPEPEIPF